MLFDKKEKITLKVEEMHCGHCTARVEKTLLGLKGVKSAKADLASKTCEVEFVPEKVSPDEMCKAVSAEGFPCTK